MTSFFRLKIYGMISRLKKKNCDCEYKKVQIGGANEPISFSVVCKNCGK